MSKRSVRRAIDAIYAELPALECHGKCAESCGPIAMSRVEWRRITEQVKTVPKATSLTCPLLVDDRCSVYAIRPTICRLWGLVESMPCPWGCQPSRVLSDVEGYAFLERVAAVGA